MDDPIGHVRPQWMVQIRRYLGFVFTRHCLCHEKSHGETNQWYNAKVSVKGLVNVGLVAVLSLDNSKVTWNLRLLLWGDCMLILHTDRVA